MADHTDDVRHRLWEHLVLTGLAVGIGFVVAMVLSLIALRFRWTYGPITWITGLLYTIPSLALFSFLLPITGFTTTTAEIGLVSYTLLILVRNIVAGIDGVPDSGAGGGRRHGLPPRRGASWTVDLRLATPAIVAGLRIATGHHRGPGHHHRARSARGAWAASSTTASAALLHPDRPGRRAVGGGGGLARRDAARAAVLLTPWSRAGRGRR